MSFLAQKKSEHEAAAQAAVAQGRRSEALFHTRKAAEFGLALAERSGGRVSEAYLRDAMALLDVAADLKAESRGSAARDMRPPIRESADDAAAEEDWLVTKAPQVRLDDVAGMEDAKARLHEMVIEPLRHAHRAREWGIKPGGGVLLFGPPGNGKTTLGKAVAGEMGAAFYYATGAQIRSKWHGQSEQRLRRLVRAARSHSLSVLFLDDIDGLLPRRRSNSIVDNRIVVQFLAEIGGFEESENVLLLLGATNKPWAIDEAVFRTGRFDEKIFVGLPDRAARERIVRKAIAPAPAGDGLSVEWLTDRLDGYTGSDIVAIVNSAKRIGFRRSVAGEGDALTRDHVQEALTTIPKSVTPEMMRRYEEFGKQRFL